MANQISSAYKRAMRDKRYLAFRHMIFNSDWYSDKHKFDRAAWFSVRPTVHETGYATGGFAIPEGVILNCSPGALARVDSRDTDYEGVNDGKLVEVIRYAGESPWWKGSRYCEGAGPCWIVRSLDGPFEVEYSCRDNPDQVSIRLLDQLPFPDFLLVPIDS